MRKLYKIIAGLMVAITVNHSFGQVIWSEDFSTASGSTPPTGWTNDDVSGSGTFWNFNNPGLRTINSPLSAPVAILDSDHFCYDYDEENDLISPVIDLSSATGGVFLHFDHYFYSGWGGAYSVEVFDGSSWNVVLSGTTSTANPKSESLNITAASGFSSAAQIKFKWTGDCSWYWIVDNISVEVIACPSVTALTSISASTSSVDISWTAGGSETSWIIEWGTPGFTPGTGAETGTDVATSNTYQVTGLTSFTTYDVYVKADCGGGEESSWTGPLAIYTGHCLPTGATNYYVSSFVTANALTNLNYSASSGVGYVDNTSTVLNTYAGNTINYTIAPNAGTNYFYIWVDWNNDLDFADAGETILATTSFASNNSGSFTVPTGQAVGDYRMRIANSWSGTVTACGPSENGNYVDFTLSVEDLTCYPPTALTASNITGNTVDLSWTAGDSETAWNVEWGAPGFTPGTGTGLDSASVTAAAYTVSGLSSLTNYDIYVQSDCGSGDESIWILLSVQTACDVYPAPFLEAFSAGSLPICWTNTSSNTVANGLWKFSGTVDYATGNTRPNGTFAWVDGSDPSSVSDVTLISPWIDVTSLTTPTLFFDYFSNNLNTYPNNIFTVEVREQAGAWTQVYTNNTSSNQWRELEFPLPAFSGTVVQVRFIVDKTPAPNGWAFYNDILLDNVKIDEPTTCPQPTVLTVSSVGSDAVDITWTAGGTETSWNVVWGLPGFTPGDADQVGTGVATATSYTINGLIENTEYDVYVQADCGAGDSSEWTGPVGVLTDCSSIPAIGFCEDFEDIDALGCWRIINANLDSDVWGVYTGYANSGDQSAGLYTDGNSGNNDDYLVLPRMTLTGNEVLNFHYRVRSSGEPNDFRVVLSTTGAAAADFTEVILPLMTASNTTYQDTSVNLSAYSGDVYIAFHVPPGGLDGWYVFIDDVCVDICVPLPGADGAVDVCSQDGTIDLNSVITSDYTHGNWIFDANPGVINGSDMNVSTFTAGSYDVSYVVTTACTSDTTIATVNVFNPSSAGTDGLLAVCKNQMIDLYGGLSGTVDFGGTWYAPNGTPLTSSYFQTGTLIGQSIYKYVVSNGVCDADTSEVIVNIQNCDFLGLEDVSLLENVTVAPNPNTGKFQIAGVPGSDYTFEVIDLNGRVVRPAKKITSTITDVNLTDVESGVYMIRITGNNSEKMIRVIKQ